MRKLNKQHIRKLGRVAKGSSFFITLPIEMIRDLKWRGKQKLIVKKKGKKLIIEDWK
jgi:hypothetical protein